MGWHVVPDAERDLVFRIAATSQRFTNLREVTVR
jgi:hypothetical protein